ncbi:MAG: hypothetical protein FJ405_17905, partial [Verrucomicrobia bacterium]|nr:hypothetical protein [Verrucomicrobiota bacterium]
MQNPHPNFSAVESQPSIHPFEIRDTTVEDAPETAALLDSVARERRFLAMTTGFSIEDTQRFISLVRATNGVHLVATLAGSIIGWCDVMPHPFETMKHSGRLGMGIR